MIYARLQNICGSKLMLFTFGFGLTTVCALNVARAQTPCPPNSWFCANTQVQVGPPSLPAQPVPPVQAQPVPPVQPAPTIIYAPPAPPPPVVYAPPAPPPVVYAPPPTPRPSHMHASEFGLGLRLGGALFGTNDRTANHSVGLVGLGVNARFRPTPRLALDLGFDALTGRDANNYARKENVFSMLALYYLNARSPLQFYLLGGVKFAAARADIPDEWGGYNRESYSYLGALFGAGIEVRFSKRIAFNFDVRGFVRTRIDENARVKPEFVADDGRTSNTSGGAFITGGLTIYF